MFGIFCLANAAFITIFIKETKGRTLEDMDILFGLVSEDDRKADVEHMLQKGLETQHVEVTNADIELAARTGGSR